MEEEAEDYKNELECERERHRAEMEEVKGDVEVMRSKLMVKEELLKEFQKVEGESESGVGNATGAVESSDDLFGTEESAMEKSSSSPGEHKEESEGGATNDREEYIR